MGAFSRSKGQRAEREVVKDLQSIIDQVYGRLWTDGKIGVKDYESGIKPAFLRRNSLQSVEGGDDIHGISFCSIEVKHRETLSIESWWKQACSQAEPGKRPVLLYRSNSIRYRCRTWGTVSGLVVLVDIAYSDFLRWFEIEVEKGALADVDRVRKGQ